jgi:carbon storage regulator CsrA
MLVLSLKINESIRLYDKATKRLLAEITVIYIDRSKTRLGIDADEDVLILRDDIDTIRPLPERDDS